MMKFRTEISPPKYSFTISHQNKLFSIGSCFSEEIGDYFAQRGFDIMVNPFGTVFNPVSISKLLNWMEPESLNFIERDGSYVAYETHSRLIGESREELVHTYAEVVSAAKNHFESSDIVIVTLGTAFVHQLISSSEVVANCHKQPSSMFVKKMLSVDDVYFALQTVVEQNSDKKFLFTVSPVRHTKEGLVENSMSKSVLRLAIEKLKGGCANVYYFPSFEIVVDDLRDYRFYEADMIHPNSQAKDYIWSILESSLFKSQTIGLSDKFMKLLRLKNHRVSNGKHNNAHKERIKKLEEDLQRELNS